MVLFVGGVMATYGISLGENEWRRDLRGWTCMLFHLPGVEVKCILANGREISSDKYRISKEDAEGLLQWLPAEEEPPSGVVVRISLDIKRAKKGYHFFRFWQILAVLIGTVFGAGGAGTIFLTRGCEHEPTLVDSWEFQWAGEKWIGAFDFNNNGTVSVTNKLVEKKNPDGQAEFHYEPIWQTETPGRYLWEPNNKTVNVEGLILRASKFESFNNSENPTLIQLDGSLSLVHGLAGKMTYKPLNPKLGIKGGSGNFTLIKGTYHSK